MPTPTVTPPTASIPLVAPPSQRADARRNREAILAAARKIFKEGGSQCPVEDIAKEAGVGVGTVYRHFPNKEALVDALIDQRFEHIAERGAGEGRSVGGLLRADALLGRLPGR